MALGFQSNAFQNSAFQTSGGVVVARSASQMGGSGLAKRKRRKYGDDLTDAQWRAIGEYRDALAAMRPSSKPTGTTVKALRRLYEVVDVPAEVAALPTRDNTAQQVLAGLQAMMAWIEYDDALEMERLARERDDEDAVILLLN